VCTGITISFHVYRNAAATADACDLSTLPLRRQRRQKLDQAGLAEDQYLKHGAKEQGRCVATLLAPDDAVFGRDEALEKRAGFPLLTAEASTGKFKIKLSARKK